ncbi:actin family [Lasiosphaeria miniovina]|uniref:Actin family n=1 Tax=Lasiosphaeria miniovina TaxID=1954250 RepID=A0AA40DVC4_9PEZI|nr:actin family [Lasiosphaeria miniovina]KAK0717724.1 actin family [Lasiosphaeria miniovina]
MSSSGVCPADSQASPFGRRVLVVDTGSYTVKAGFGGDVRPSSEFASIVGYPRHVPVCTLGMNWKSNFTGPEITDSNRFMLNVVSPLQDITVTNWDSLETLWAYTFGRELNANAEDHAVAMTEPAGWGPRDREKFAMIMFETFDVPALFSSTTAPLALYASGRTTGLVVDSGHGATSVMPVYAGFPLPHAVRPFAFAGRDVTSHLRSMMLGSSAGSPRPPAAGGVGTARARITGTERWEDDLAVIRDIKHARCGVSLGVSADSVASGSDPEKSELGERLYTLPDGQTITVGETLASRAPEPMFTPIHGLQSAVLEAVARVDHQLRGELLGNIVLAGGNTLLPGFSDRLRKELDAAVPRDAQVNVVAPHDAQYSAWRGASMLAGLGTFRHMAIPKETYDEYGPMVLRWMCLGLGV